MVVIDNLHVAFNLLLNPDETLRGQFVGLLKNPYQHLVRNKDVLHVLKGVSLKARRGDRIALIGKNGAGKTTLCRCIAGIYGPKKGSIQINGSIKAILDPRSILYPELTGRENARIVMSLFHDGSESQLQEALEFSELGRFLDVPFRTYSSGMQTRLCLSVASCQSADVFLLDEVFDGADQSFQQKMSKRIMNLIERSGVVFFVSHSEEQIRRVCNRAIYLKDGHIVADGNLDEVFALYNRDSLPTEGQIQSP